MPTLTFGQRRRAKAALNSASQAIARAHNTALAGDYGAALSRYDEAIEMLQSDSYRQWLTGGVIEESEWHDQLALAQLGKVRAVAALDPRKSVFEQAEKMLNEVLAAKPDWSEPTEFLAGLAVARGYPGNAAQYINKLLAANPRHQRARFLQAVLEFDTGKFDSASEKLASLPESGESLCYLGRCRLKMGKVEAAIRTFERARERFGDTYELNYYHGCALAHGGRYDEARGLFVSAAAIDTRRADPNLQLANLSLVTGQLSESERYFTSAISLGPRVSLAVHYGLALIAAAQGSDQVKRHLDAVSLIDPDSDLLRCARGDQLERAGRLEEARSEFVSISKQSPMYSQALTRVGFINYRSGDYAGAAGALAKAAELRSSDSRLLKLLGAAAAQIGDYQLASTSWGQLVRRGVADEATTRALDRIRFWTALQKLNQGCTVEAVSEVGELYRESGSDPAAARALADLYFRISVDLLEADPPDAHRAKEFLLLGKHLNSHPKFDYLLALADLIQGHFQPATTRLHSVLAANAKNPGASYHLGLALARSGDFSGAENVLRHGISVAMNNPAKAERMKWALSLLLARQRKWGEAWLAVEDLEADEQTDSPPSPVQLMDLRIRCLAGQGSWEEAERLAIGAPSRQQSSIGAIILARRNMKSGRLDAALSHATRFLYLMRDRGEGSRALVERTLKKFAQLALKAAALSVRDSLMTEAEDVLRGALSTLAEMGQPPEAYPQIRGFLAGLKTVDEERRVKRLAQGYESLAIELIFEREDVEPPSAEAPVILPSKSSRTVDPNDGPVFDPGEWDCSSNPDPMVVFDS